MNRSTVTTPHYSPSTAGAGRVHLTLLGPARFTVPGVVDDEPLTPRRALLAGLLADAGRAGVPRERLGALLWPHADAPRASNAAKQMVHKLRQQIGVTNIIEMGVVVRFNHDVTSTDLAALLEAERMGRHEDVITLCTGRFLDGVEAWEPADLEHWLDAQRRRAMRVLRDATLALASAHEAVGDTIGAERRWAQLVERHPSDEWARERLAAAQRSASGDGNRQLTNK